MYSHVVIFWTNPENPQAPDALIAGADQYLKTIPGILSFHVGKMQTSHRAVVDQTYQVALNIIFESRGAESAYQTHPQHLDFVEKVFKANCVKAVIYDFE